MGGRLAAAVGLAVLGFAVGRHTAGQEQERSWAAYTGRDWRGFTPAEKRAYVAGFPSGSPLAGARRAGAGRPGRPGSNIGSLSKGWGVPLPFGRPLVVWPPDEPYSWC